MVFLEEQSTLGWEVGTSSISFIKENLSIDEEGSVHIIFVIIGGWNFVQEVAKSW
jgi:hypothetical protein